MKKYLTIIIALFLFASCKKETSNSNTIDNLFTETKDNVQRNEPILLSFGDNSTQQNVVWQCTPNVAVTKNDIGDYATFIFANAGTYTITAKNSNNKQGTYIVSVVNTLYNELGSSFTMSPSKLINVGINEDVVFTAYNINQNIQDSDWIVHSIPSTLKGFSNNNKSITVSFQTAGAKYVSLKNGNSYETKTIWVVDSSLNNNINVPFLFGDKLNITPSIVLNNGKRNLQFSTQATYKYRCSTDNIIADIYNRNGTYILSFGGAAISANTCAQINAPSSNNTFANMVAGNTYPFAINYQNKTFNGSVTVDSVGTYNINFNDNNLINIFPKSIK